MRNKLRYLKTVIDDYDSLVDELEEMSSDWEKWF